MMLVSNASVPMDNNQTEQLMKQIAVGRKNWLFSGSVAGGERSAGLAPLSCLTLVSSALRNDLDVWQYVKDVLDQLLAGVTDYHVVALEGRKKRWHWPSRFVGTMPTLCLRTMRQSRRNVTAL